MAKAKKLPSGSWRCLVYDYTDSSGKRKYKSFTSYDPSPKGKREVEFQAAEYAANKSANKTFTSDMCFYEALETYLVMREPVLSPSTIRSYRAMQIILQRSYDIFCQLKIRNMTQDDIQNVINNLSANKSPKTVRNYHGLISSVLSENGYSAIIKTTMPKKIRPTLYIPSDEDVKRIITFSMGTDMELPILLAAFGPMRRGEIAALNSNHIKGNTVHVELNMVMDSNREWIIKAPKSYSGNRYIDYPDFVAEKFKNLNGQITTLNPNRITSKFERILDKMDIPHFRFHDLRHYSASIQHALGIPDVYIMQRGGWGNDSVLKSIYRHALDAEQEKANTKVNDYFSNLCNTKCNTKKINP